jgi:hypothetical protein
MSRILLLDAATFALSRSQPTNNLSEWRTGAGNCADRILLEFRGCRWSLLATSAASMQSISNSLWTLMKSSTQSASTFLAQLLQVDVRLFQPIDSPDLQPQLAASLLTSGSTVGTATAAASTAASTGRLAGAGGHSFNLPRIHYRNELEMLQTMLHFPEEVALRLAEVDHELFYSVQPVDFVRHITCSLSSPSPSASSADLYNTTNLSCTTSSGQPTSSVIAGRATVHDLIRRFNEVSNQTIDMFTCQTLVTSIDEPPSTLFDRRFDTSVTVEQGEKVKPEVYWQDRSNPSQKSIDNLIHTFVFLCLFALVHSIRFHRG